MPPSRVIIYLEATLQALSVAFIGLSGVKHRRSSYHDNGVILQLSRKSTKVSTLAMVLQTMKIDCNTSIELQLSRSTMEIAIAIHCHNLRGSTVITNVDNGMSTMAWFD